VTIVYSKLRLLIFLRPVSLVVVNKAYKVIIQYIALEGYVEPLFHLYIDHNDLNGVYFNKRS